MKQAILWDLDGTLLYTLQDIANATNATLRAFHLPERSLEEVRSFVGNGAAQQMRRSAGGEPENFEEIMAFYRAYYPQHCNETTRPYDGILETASQLKANRWRLAIVSNKPDDATKSLWRAYFPDFDLALGEAPGVARKPAPDMVIRALEQLGTQRTGCLHRRLRGGHRHRPGRRDSVYIRLLGIPGRGGAVVRRRHLPVPDPLGNSRRPGGARPWQMSFTP